MDLWSVIAQRRSVRRYLADRPVTDEQVQRILEAGIAAPSAGNAQPWFFYVVRSQEIKDALARAALNQDFVAQAPVVIVVCVDLERARDAYGSRGEHLYCLQDTAAATQNMLLGVTALGLGACWVGAFDERAAARALGLPSHLRPVVIMPIGHPAHQPAPRPRRDLKAVSRQL
ncbi:MAG: nitroreductase family protein [Chloroflexi bacterium]|nr:nitroreductase family protein [Chloroflexota bacterium]